MPIDDHRLLLPGEPAPWFSQRSTSSADYHFDSAAGRYIVLCFFGSAAFEHGQRALAFVAAQRAIFDDDHVALFGVSVDPRDEALGRVRPALPGIRHFWDFDGRVSRLYGALPASDVALADARFRPQWVALNPNLQVRCVIPFAPDGSDNAALLRALAELPPIDGFVGAGVHAPVLVLADVFEPAFCRLLIEQYERRGNQPSGFMRDQRGVTRRVTDSQHKVRRDHFIHDPALRQQVDDRIVRTLAPALKRVQHFELACLERYLVGCYDQSDGGHFRPHRDNTTLGTAHRPYALSINLNDDFDGGTVAFPEYGSRRYKLPPGAGLVFSCSLLHAVDPVRRGRRYAFLPFLLDASAARQRDANRRHVEGEALPPGEAEVH